MIIDHLTTMYRGHNRKLVVYWLCDDAIPGPDVSETMLGSLIQQLMPTNLPIPDFVREVYDNYRMEQSFPKYNELLGVFRRLVQEASHDIMSFWTT